VIHPAFDASWFYDWKEAVRAVRVILEGDGYNWVSHGINTVDGQVIGTGVNGAISDGLRTEMFFDLGLREGDVIVAGRS
jgi:hypothetical protein